MEPFRVIRLTQGMATIVDPEDYDRVAQHKWNARYDPKTRSFRAVHTYYAPGTPGHTTYYLARFILDAPKGMHVDHINHDTLDNRRCNLRICNSAENRRNASSHICEHKGVHWHSRDKVWCASIRVDKKLIHLGSYHDKSLAISAYNNAAIEYFGEFACLNQE